MLDKLFYGRRETADLFSVSVDTIDRIAEYDKQTKLHRRYVGTKVVFAKEDILAEAERLKKEGRIYA